MDYILNQHLQSFAAEQTLKSLCLKIRKNILVEGVPKISIQDIPKQQLQWGKKKNSTRFDSSKVKSHRSELGQVSFLNFSSLSKLLFIHSVERLYSFEIRESWENRGLGFFNNVIDAIIERCLDIPLKILQTSTSYFPFCNACVL